MPVATAPDDIVSTHAEAERQRPPAAARRRAAAGASSTSTGSARATCEAEPVGEGHSNVTYVVRRGDAEVVLRRPPRPPLPPSAHDVLREARLLRALAGTAARVPRVLAVVRRRVGHRRAVLRDGAPGRRGHHRRAFPLALDTPRATAADGRGARRRARRGPRGRRRGARPRGASASRAATSSASSSASTGCGSTTARATCPPSSASAGGCASNLPEYAGRDDRARRLPARQHDVRRRVAGAADRRSSTGRWRRRRPAGRRRLPVHAVGRPRRPRRSGCSSSAAVTRQEGFPRRAELVARYEEALGRSVTDLRWYTTLALWKSVVFMEGNYQPRGRAAPPTTRSSSRSARASSSSPTARRRWPSCGG